MSLALAPPLLLLLLLEGADTASEPVKDGLRLLKGFGDSDPFA